MDADFPAAHSMDTTWFAVDRDGHVAYFSSGEAGAVPLEACAGEDAYELVRWLEEVVPPGEPVQDLTGRRMPGADPTEPFHESWPGEMVLAFLTSLAPVQPYLDAGRATPVRATDGLAVLLPDLSEEELRALQAAPECRGTVSLDGEEAEREPATLARHGVYVYDHLTENWISGPYGREVLPAPPLHIDQLPPEFRESVGQMRFTDLCFADTPHLQPVEHAECASWESAYIDAAGKRIRAIPGKEDEYAELFDGYASDSGFEVEPPGPG